MLPANKAFRLRGLSLLLLWGVCVSSSAAGQQPACTPLLQEGATFVVCRFNPVRDHLELFNMKAGTEPWGSFDALKEGVAASGKTLFFAMNAGMFDASQRAIGLYVEDGKMLHKANRRAGYGNFHLKPNGVFYLAGTRAGVLETEAWLKANIIPDFATQSGPMLVIDGKIHPKFSETGPSAKIRNGVGVTAEGDVIFAISNMPVNFYSFASLFRDALECPNALFLDGSISSLYSEELGRNDNYRALGPIIGVLK